MSSTICNCVRRSVASSSAKGKARAAPAASSLRQLHASTRAGEEAEAQAQQQQPARKQQGRQQRRAAEEAQSSLQEGSSGLTPLDANVQAAPNAAAGQAEIPGSQGGRGGSSGQLLQPPPAVSSEMQDVLDRRRRLALMDSLESIGSTQTRKNTWQPHHSLSRSPTPASLTLSHLLASTAHLGHSTSLASPMAFPYIYGTRHGISVIDVRETLSALRRAAALVRSTVENDGIVLFLGGGMKETERVLAKNADKLGRNGYATNKWMPGTITNSSKLFAESSVLIEQAPREDNPDSDARRRSTPTNPTHLHPSLLIMFSPLSTPHALREANAYNIPTIALCDSNVDPRHFTYPIPANDDSVRLVELISGVLAEAGREGIRRREANERRQMASQQALSGWLAKPTGQPQRFRISAEGMERPDNRFNRSQ